LVEITPNYIRMRKKVLNKDDRAKYNKQQNLLKAQ